jgi:hypothetical protein
MSMGRSSSLPLWKTGAGTDEGDQVWRVGGAPAGLNSLGELVGHRQPDRPGAQPFGDFGPQTYCGEGAFDRYLG